MHRPRSRKTSRRRVGCESSRCRLPAAVRLGLPLLLAAATLPGCGSGGDTEAGKHSGPPPATVEVTVVEPRLLVDRVALTGQLEAEYEVLMQPEIDGVVASIDFVEGQPVARGDVLITLRDDVQRARVAEAQAELRLAQQVFDRESKLARRDASSLSKIEESQAELDTARARLRLAEIDLERTRIRAPFDGVPGARLVAPGARVEDSDGLVPIASIDRLQVLFTVPENALALAHPGATIQVRVAAWPEERFPGEVFFVSPTVDPATRRLVLKAWIPNEGHRLKPGMFANVDVEVAQRQDALIVPEAAMVYDRHGSYVWRVREGDVVEKVPVKIGLRSEGTVEIVQGLAPGDAVISAGTHKVMAGNKVDVVGRESQAGQTDHAAEGVSSRVSDQDGNES